MTSNELIELGFTFVDIAASGQTGKLEEWNFNEFKKLLEGKSKEDREQFLSFANEEIFTDGDWQEEEIKRATDIIKGQE